MTKSRIFYFGRLLQTGIAFVPVCLGVFAFINNITDWTGTIARVVSPLLTMEGNAAYKTQGWRAIDVQFLTSVIYGFVTLLELFMGLIAAYGAIGMIRYRKSSCSEFRKYSYIVCLACLLGALIYCFIFFTVGGDWFLSWKNENLLFIQGDSLNYALVLMIVFLFLYFFVEQAE